MESIPNREDWEKEFKNKFPRHGYDSIHENEFHTQLMLDFIRNLLQSHNNALVAEIEIRILKQLIQRETHLKETLEKIKKPTDFKIQGMIEITNNNILYYEQRIQFTHN